MITSKSHNGRTFSGRAFLNPSNLNRADPIADGGVDSCSEYITPNQRYDM
jgi:hypothetical protein